MVNKPQFYTYLYTEYTTRNKGNCKISDYRVELLNPEPNDVFKLIYFLSGTRYINKLYPILNI